MKTFLTDLLASLTAIGYCAKAAIYLLALLVYLVRGPRKD